VFSSCFTSANSVVIPARIMCTPATTTNKSECDKRQAVSKKKVTTRLTLKILRQLGVALAQLHRLLGDRMGLLHAELMSRAGSPPT
jgi:hypothetical protein